MLSKNNHSFIGNYHVTSEQGTPVFLHDKSRARHVYILGQTGTGKSTFLRQLITQDIHAGKGVALFDIHGDLAEEVLASIPPSRAKDVVYFDASNRERPIGFNPLAGVPEEQKSLVTDNIVSALKNIWSHSWGDRMEYVLKNTILALLDCPEEMEVSLLSVSRMLTDPMYRVKVVKHIQNPEVKHYWKYEFAALTKPLRQQFIQPVLNKVNTFATDPLLRNIIGQGSNKVDIARVMDSGQIFIANLSKGKIGAKNANLLGSLLVSMFQQQALSRAYLPKEKRRPFYMYIDEFQNYTTQEFVSIFSEARKFALSLTIGHQFRGQISEKVRGAISGNIANIILFAVSSADAEEFSKEFTPIKTADFTGLDTGQVYARLQGLDHRKNAMKLSLLDHHLTYGRAEKFKNFSHERYGRRSTDVDLTIAQRFEKSKPDRLTNFR